jgi:hypothetical protein
LISFFPANTAGKVLPDSVRPDQRGYMSCRHDHGLRHVVRSSRVLAETLATHFCVRRVLPPAGHGGANSRGQRVRNPRRRLVRDTGRPGPRDPRSSPRAVVVEDGMGDEDDDEVIRVEFDD